MVKNVNRQFTEEEMHIVKKTHNTKTMFCTGRQDVDQNILTVRKKFPPVLMGEM